MSPNVASHADELAQPSRSRVVTVIFTAASVLLALAGGIVPAVDHQVRRGALPPQFDPQRYFGDPSIGSVSGLAAALGALTWTFFMIFGVVLAQHRLRLGFPLVLIALLIALSINVVVPLTAGNINWSPIGVAQAFATATAAIAVFARRESRSK